MRMQMGAQRCKRFVIIFITRIQGRNETAGGLPCSSNGNESAGDQGLIPGLGRSYGEGNGNPLQYSCLENSMDREAWWATVHGVAKSRTWLTDSHTHTHTHSQLEGFWDLVTIKPMEDVMEKKRCLWLFSPWTQNNLEGKSEMCERYAVPFAMEFDSSSFPVSLQPLTMALAFHFSIGQYKYIKFLKMFPCQWFHQGHRMRFGWHIL